jgi:gamma-carbonic anhydrase
MMRIFSLDEQTPRLAGRVFVAPGSVLIGDVEIGAQSSIWFNCVVRGDAAPIRIGTRSNVQDGSIVHADPGFPTIIGDDALIGHMTLIHGCTIQDRGFIGMGAIVMNGAIVESDAILAAGAMLTERKVVKSGELWAGRPAKFLRLLSDKEIEMIRHGANHYRELAARYLEACH